MEKFSNGFTVTAQMMLGKNTKVMVRSPDGDCDCFDIATQVLQGDTLVLFLCLFIICLNHVRRRSIDLMKENVLTLKNKSKNRRYPRETKTIDIDNTEGLAFLANTPAQVESLLYNLEQTARDIGLHVNLNKTDFICFNQDHAILLNGKALNLANHFKNLRSNISSTESYINLHIDEARAAIDRLTIIWQSDLSDKVKRKFF